MLCYVDLTVDITKLTQYLANGVDFGYKENAVQLTFGNKTYCFRINEINQSGYIENIEFLDYNLKKKKAHLYLFSIQRISR